MGEVRRQPIDVICQHRKDGEIIPMRLRLCDDDGEPHAFTIKSYKDLSHKGAYVTPDGMYVTNNILVFECRIEVFGVRRLVRLYYNQTNNIWEIGGMK